MKSNPATVAILWLALATFASTAAAQMPSGSTGQCKDGSYSSAASKRGACAGHGGVKDWYEGKKATESESKMPAATANPSTAAPPSKSTKTSETPTTAAVGANDSKVWVNTSSKVYHCSSDRWYGKTKKGEYMSEAEANAKGNHPDHGKICTK